MANKLLYIPINKIRENPVALRTVNRTSEEYMGLVDSIRSDGILNPILVREMKDPVTDEIFYSLVDGLHRFSGSQDAGLETIPAHVADLEEGEILEAQILCNIHKIETRPVEYSKQLMRILAQNPLMTTTELAGRLSKSTAWLNERLGLTKLDPKIATLVDEGKVNLSNAYALAKLPTEEQVHYLDRAQTMTPQEFVPTCVARAKEIRDAKRAGRDASPTGEFIPVAHLRKISELKTEVDSGSIATVLIEKYEVTNPVQAFKLAIQWALHLDRESVKAAQEKDEARKKQLKAQNELRKAERLKQQAEEAAQRAAAVGATA